jgi:dTDP-4-dehydrorhamnose reductase
MLGQDLMAAIPQVGHQVIGMDLPEIDITEPASVADALSGAEPDVVVNAAAYTAVDAAEADEATALRGNGDGPAVLAAAVAGRPGTRLIHISTDYVFDGAATTPYDEDATPNPRTAYGRTKLAGELEVQRLLPERHLLVRTAWLYGAHGANFVRTMLTLEQTRPTISVVADQWGQPTWSWDLARQVVALADADPPPGRFHATSTGQTTWFGLTQEIFRLIGADPERVKPTTTELFPRPAPRPAFSVLGHRKWAEVGLTPIQDWRSALAQALPVMGAGSA